MTFTEVSAGQLIKSTIANQNWRHAGRLGFSNVYPMDSAGSYSKLDLGSLTQRWGSGYFLETDSIYAVSSGGVSQASTTWLDLINSAGLDSCILNFSIDQKEDSESTEVENLTPYAQTIPFGCSFSSLSSNTEKLNRVDSVLVPADSHEVTCTGTWTNEDSANWKFGRAKVSSTDGDTAVFSFTGVSISLGSLHSTDLKYFTAELSSDGGSTWTRKKTMTQDADSLDYNVIYDLYDGLEFGDYQVRITVNVGKILIGYFSYTTYMVQQPISHYALASGGATDIDDVPAGTSFVTGTWTVNDQNTASWNNSRMDTTNTNAEIELKFYGNAIWLGGLWQASGDVDVDVYIDGVQTKVKASSINLDTPNNSVPSWIRLDDGTLTDDVHTVKLDVTTVTAGGFWMQGWGWYSDSQASTLCHDLIVGDSSYTVGIDDSGFSFSGAGWGAIAESAAGFLRRYKVTSTATNYAEYTTPNNSDLKAIYGVFFCDNSPAGAEVALTLDGGTTRYINIKTNNYELQSSVHLLYDSEIDGTGGTPLALENKTLRITNNDGGQMELQGLVFEIWGDDKIGTNHITVMPKWTRNNVSTNLNTPVSNTYRFSVSGSGKSGTDALPQIHSGWCNIGATTQSYWRHGTGLPITKLNTNIMFNSTGPISGDLECYDYEGDARRLSTNDPGQLTKENVGASGWYKIVANLPRVI